MTAVDRAVQAQARAYHRSGAEPRVTHYIHERFPDDG
jgi:hypothetical protein